MCGEELYVRHASSRAGAPKGVGSEKNTEILMDLKLVGEQRGLGPQEFRV